MRIAIDGVYFGLNAGRRMEEFVELARAVGANGVNWPFHPDYGAAAPESVAGRLKDAGLAAVSLGLTRHLEAVPGGEQEFRQMFGEGLEAARRLGAGVIDCWPQRPAEVDLQRARAALAANLDAVAPRAERAGCVLSLEFEPGIALERFRGAAEFLAPWSPAVRLTVDTYHVIRVGDELTEAAALGARTGIVHFSGSHRGEPGSAGDRCDYRAFLRAALEAGYGGDVVLQYTPPPDTFDSLRRAVALARRLVAASA